MARWQSGFHIGHGLDKADGIHNKHIYPAASDLIFIANQSWSDYHIA
jgi:hypothetical protein